MRIPASKSLLKDMLLLSLGAGLYTLAAPPYEWSVAAWLALTPLYLVVRDKTLPGAFAAGAVYGLLFSAGLANWIFFSVATFFPVSPVAALGCTLLVYLVYVCPYTGLVAVGSCMLMRQGSGLRWVGIPALWVSGEFARALFSGFAWELLGYTQYRQLPLIQIVDMTGIYGLTFLLALSSYVGAECVRSLQLSRGSFRALPWPALGGLTVGIALICLYGLQRIDAYAVPAESAGTPLEVAVVQGDGTNQLRWQPAYYASTMLQYTNATRQGVQRRQPDLVVWPEFAVGFYLDKNPMLRFQLGLLTRSLQAPLLLGAPRRERTSEGQRYYNSAYLLAPGGQILGVYDKRRLLPFAEYRPWGLPGLLSHSPTNPNQFTAGQQATVFDSLSSPLGVMICYEVTFPGQVRQFAEAGAQVLVNISNDGWLAAGGLASPAQHFSMAVIRAVENRRPLVRATTSAGISGFIDPTGRPSHLSVQDQGVLVGTVIPRQELSLYTRYGDWFACVCLGWGVLSCGWAAKTRRQLWK